MVQACWCRWRAWQESGTPAGQPQTSIQPKLPPPPKNIVPLTTETVIVTTSRLSAESGHPLT
jgi:hypothetical protein